MIGWGGENMGVNVLALLRSPRVEFSLFGMAIIASLIWTASATGDYSISGLVSTKQSYLWAHLIGIGAVRDPIALDDVMPDDKAHLVDQLSKRFSAEKWEAVQTAVETSIANSPLNSRMWLVLAISIAAQHSLPANVAAALKMSYYTGANDLTITEPRLTLALTVAMRDSELKNAVRRDIRNISLGDRKFRGIVTNAYCHASQEGRAVIDEIERDFDPSEKALDRAC
jgi:hypothetical protein